MSLFGMEIEEASEVNMALRENSDSSVLEQYTYYPDFPQSSEDSDDEGSISSVCSTDIETFTPEESVSEEYPTEPWPSDHLVQIPSNSLQGFPVYYASGFSEADPLAPWRRQSMDMSIATQNTFLWYMKYATPYGVDQNAAEFVDFESVPQGGDAQHPVMMAQNLELEAPLQRESPVRRKARMKITPTRSELAAFLNQHHESLDAAYLPVQAEALDLRTARSGSLTASQVSDDAMPSSTRKRQRALQVPDSTFGDDPFQKVYTSDGSDRSSVSIYDSEVHPKRHRFDGDV